MTLTITDTPITPGGAGEADCREDRLWYLTGHPRRATGRNQAITAMTPTQERPRPDPDRTLTATPESELS